MTGELGAVLRGRRSVRKFRPDPIDDETVLGLLEAARWAPSPHNSQPWRFVILRPGATRERLATVMAERWLSDLTEHDEVSERLLRRVATRRHRLLEAPAALVACLTNDGLDDYPDPARRAAEWATAEQSLGAAVQNLLLTVHAQGLGACWICAPTFCDDLVRSALDLPAAWSPRVLVLIGQPERPPAESPRRPLDSFVLFR